MIARITGTAYNRIISRVGQNREGGSVYDSDLSENTDRQEKTDETD